MPHLQITLLGSPAVHLDSQPVEGFVTQKAQALLYYLITTKQPHSRDLLAALLWAHAPDNRARNNLSYTLTNLRKLVGSHLQISRHTIGFDPESNYALDVDELKKILQKNLQEITSDDEEKLATLYRGEFLQGFYVRNAEPFEEWLLQEREKQKTDVVYRLNRLVDMHLLDANYNVGIAGARRLLEIEPWHEEAQCQLMICLAGEGQTGLAITGYRTFSERLHHEFGVEPGEGSKTVYESLLTTQLVSGLADWQAAALQKIFGHEQQGQSSGGVFNAQSQVVRQSIATSNTLHQPPPNNLDVLPSGSAQQVLFGREQVRARGLSWLEAADKRVLLLHGPSGVGKTEVAREIARCAVINTGTDQRVSDGKQPFLGAFDGVYFVYARPISSSTDTAAQSLYTLFDAIADVLQIEKGAAETLQAALFYYLRTRRLLLILDSLDSVVLRLGGKKSALIGQLNLLLQEAPSIRIIVTVDTLKTFSFADTQTTASLDLSDRLSHVRQITQVVLAPLEVFSTYDKEVAELASDASSAHANSAIKLFRKSVAPRSILNTKATSEISHTELRQMISICRLVNGLPFAIKLAAGLLNYMQLYEVEICLEELSVEQMERSTQISPVEPTRTYSLLLKVIDNCLNSHEQRIMMRLSICTSSFSERAAREIGLASQATLKKLVDTALLRQTEQSRYQLHESVRHFFYAKLTHNQPLFREAHQRFCSYFAVWLERLMETMGEAASGDSQSAFLQERKNIIHAFDLSKKLNYASAAQRLAKFMD